jgi:Kef-type K+ transport system membrane component KefB
MRLMIIVRASRAIILCLLERCWGLNSDTARRLGPVLCQGGEFAFALLAADAIQGVIGEPIANLLTLAVTLSMARLKTQGDTTMRFMIIVTTGGSRRKEASCSCGIR